MSHANGVAALNDVNVKLAEHEVRLENVEQKSSENRGEIREIRGLLWAILIMVIGTLLSINLPKLPLFR